MEIKILGISGSPVADGNAEVFLNNILDFAEKYDVPFDVRTEAVYLSTYEVEDCIHCNFCLTKQIPGKYCSINDEMQEIYEKVAHADIILLLSPVYFMRTSGRMAAFIDRLRVFIFGNITGGMLKNKIGVSAAVAWLRNGGFETTHMSHHFAFLTLEMIPASAHNCISPMGASAYSSPDGTGMFDKKIRLGVEHDTAGLESGRMIMKRAIELSCLVKK
ncbi:flavodoxin [Desulfosarcina widdelii]|uniref:Flavodoxin n=1 Tax=Desulfosarcina widdelii TaxID=947919 RepID=A0A5K7ZDP4_9BACT|nr:flavodoxin family protein [Desulfosarcina widdelii]BBO77841.1 flavodoxin [Desulfosarcina widdelii]